MAVKGDKGFASQNQNAFFQTPKSSSCFAGEEVDKESFVAVLTSEVEVKSKWKRNKKRLNFRNC